MSRPFKGLGSVTAALDLLASAKSVEQLRQAQAVVLPLRYGLSLSQTAEALGVSATWASRLRKAFLDGHSVGGGSLAARGGRHRENFTREREAETLKLFIEKAAVGCILVVGQLKLILEKARGEPMALSSVYNLLYRHGWRKLTPDKRHPQSDPVAQEVFKKKLPDILCEIRQDFAQGAPIRLMFQDEARFGRINDVRRCWAPKPIRPLCGAMLTHENTYAYAAIDIDTGELAIP